MNKKFKKILFASIACITIITGLTACNNNEDKVPVGNGIVSGELEKKEDMATYNNGGNFVQYKGNTYYREYKNADFLKTGVNGTYEYDTEAKNVKYINVISNNGKIKNVFEDNGYGKFYMLDDRFYFTNVDDKIYSVNMKGEDYIEFCKGEYIGINEKEHKIYYKNNNNNGALYVVDTQTLKITKLLNDEELKIDKNIQSNTIANSENGFVLLEKNEVIFSNTEVDEFKNRYVSEESSEYIVNINGIEKTKEKLYFVVELSKHLELDGEQYERVASEVYTYDIKNGKKTLLYLYKAVDEDEMENGDIYGSGVENNGPLAENEMYLEIKLEGKGFKENFDVRVEEVGGLIMGKRIEYEGMHNRNEKILKIKVTKEIGAMLSVYIDNELDTQMLIEE